MKKIFLILNLALALSANAYFQQDVNYKISVVLNDQNHSLSAFESLEYTNNSPQTLNYIWFHIWPNAYKNNNTALANQFLKQGKTDFYFSKPEERGFIDSLDFKVNNQTISWEYHPEHIDIVKLNLTEPLKPGEKIIITTPFKVKIPIGKFSRLGHIKQQYQITQWYPKPAVLDKNGWHPIPYLNQGEFYSEFGSFEVKITLPENYVVGATGNLQEASEIVWLDSLARKTKYITEFPEDNSFPLSSKKLKTLTYKQSQVHDFAWFADKRYNVLKGSVKLPNSEKEVTTWVMFTNQYAEFWTKSIPYVNDAVYYYSKWNGDYPYNHATAVDGALSAGSGMEYPNITVIGRPGTDKLLENVIMHEVGHNWFYGILGSNEREFPWLDEGLNTYNEIRYMNLKFPAEQNTNKVFELAGFDKTDHFDNNLLGYLFAARLNTDQPINTNSEDMRGLNYGLISYFKSGIVFTYLRNIYGDEKMDAAMKSYYEKWKFKHPYPEDLQISLETSLQTSLDWFFDGLINSKEKVDYKYIKSRKTETGKDILVKNLGGINAPFYMVGSDSTKKLIPGFEGKEWISTKNKEANYTVGTRYLPDAYPLNNSSNFDKGYELKFLSSAENSNLRQLYFMPIIGWNNTNKTMLGLALHNIGVPNKKFEYLFMPMQSLAGKSQNNMADFLLGSAELNYRIFPKNIFRQILIRTAYQSYGLPAAGKFTSSGFTTWKNSVNFKIEPKKPNGSISQDFSITSIYVEESITGINGNEVIGFETDNHFLTGEYTIKNDKTINEILGNANIELNTDFLRIGVNGEIKHLYAKKGYVNIRGFLGAFAFNNTISPRYNWRMDGQNGFYDYTYSEIFPDRGGNNSAFQNQFIENHGGFKVPTALGQSNSWLASSNLKVKLPIGLPIGVFADAGIYPSFNSTDFIYDAGIYFPLINNFFSVYMPLTYSTSIENYLNINNIDFAERIRFILSINSLNVVKLRENINLF